MSYSDNFQFGTGPKIVETQGWWSSGSPSTGGYWINKPTKSVSNGQQDDKAASAFDGLMAAHDAVSDGYINKLKGFYDGYAQYAKDFGAQAKGVIGFLNGDIKQMSKYVNDYSGTLSEIKDTMMNGIKLDPNATRTREEYQGNVANAFAKTAEQQNQQMTSQGLNPYANTGASRATNLARTAGMADAGNTAYKDWHTQYNQDVQAKQQGMSAYAGLEAKQGDMQSQLMQGRGLILGGYKSIYDANMGSAQAAASGYEGLLGQENSRRQETLGLAQQQQAKQQHNDDIQQQLEAKLSPYDKWAAAQR